MSELALAASSLLFASAALSLVLARLDPLHRPVAIAISATSGASIARAILRAAVLHGGPYTGWARAAFHIEQALYLVSTVAVPWLAIVTLTAWPPGPTRARTLSAWASAVLIGTALVLIAGYPGLRDGPLRQIYLGAELAALLGASIAIVSWILRRGWRGTNAPDGLRGLVHPDVIGDVYGLRWYTWSAVLMIVVADLGLLFAGAWRYGLFGPAYEHQDAGLIALWGVVAAVHGTAIAVERRRS